MTRTDVQKLNGALDFVQSDEDDANPPVGLRGTVQIGPDDTAWIHLQYAAMFFGRVRQRFIPLSHEDLEALLRSEHDGNYTFHLRGPIEGPSTAASPPPLPPDHSPPSGGNAGGDG